MTTIATPYKSVTAKSVVEKLKSLSSSATNRTIEGVENITHDITENVYQPSMLSTIITILKYIVIILIICFVLLNILAINGLLSQSLADFFNSLLIFTKSQEKPQKEQKQIPATAINTEQSEQSDKSYDKPTIKALEHALKHVKKDIDILEDHAGSSIQETHNSKSGYCYIGEDSGFRSCIKVKNIDDCMSGDIFPTKDICINPNLRQ